MRFDYDRACIKSVFYKCRGHLARACREHPALGMALVSRPRWPRYARAGRPRHLLMHALNSKRDWIYPFVFALVALLIVASPAIQADEAAVTLPPPPAPDTRPVTLPLIGGKVTVYPDQPFSPITIRFKNHEVKPVNLGPVLDVENQPLSPGQYHPVLFRASRDPQSRTVYLVYKITECKTPTFYWLTISTDGSQIKLAFEMRNPITTAVLPGAISQREQYKLFTMTPRIRESWEQNSAPPAFWNTKGKFWVYSQWSLDASNATNIDEMKGTWGDMLSTVPGYIVYAGNYRRPLKDTLTIGVSNDLWLAAGASPNRPSEYADEMKGMMFLDLWNGTNEQNRAFVAQLGEKVRGLVKFYTIVQTWQAGGFDVYNPDAYWPKTLLPDIRSLKSLVDEAARFGRVGLRTNYFFINHSPSAKAGLIQGRVVQAVAQAGALMSEENQNFSQASIPDWWRLARFQEADIHRTFRTSGLFVDQVSSLGGAGFMQDMTPYNVGTGIARFNTQVFRQFCRNVKKIHQGPLSSETLNSEHLLGYWVDTGDYGIFNGANRLLSPEYKLHRLHRLGVFHGMGLAYRFYGYPQAFQSSGDWLGSGHGLYFGLNGDFYAPADNYRAMEVLYGNGAYYYAIPGFEPSQRSRDEHAFTEAMTVGMLQPHYALEPVENIEYFWKDKWRTLNELMMDNDIAFQPNLDNCPAFKTIRVQYANGLSVTVNRSETPIHVTAAGQELTLNQYGWVGAKEDGSILVYSAISPLAKGRIDYTYDKQREAVFINPRSQTIAGIETPMLFIKDEIPAALRLK